MRRSVALLLVLVALAGACSRGDDDERPDDGDDAEEHVDTTVPPTTGGRVVVGLEGAVDVVDPAAAPFTPSELSIGLALYDPLLATSSDGDVVPYLAASFEGDDEHTRWLLGLRPDVTFSDGTPVDASAVVASFDRLLSSPVLQGALRPLLGITALDAHAVEITTEPWPELPMLLTGQLGLVRSPDGAGSGPFVVAEVVPGDHVSLVRNERHWRWSADGIPWLDAVELRTVADVDDRIAQLVRGDLDVIHVAGDDALDALWDADGVLVGEPTASSRAVVLLTNPGSVDACVASAAAGDEACDDDVELVLRTDQPDEVLVPLLARLEDGNVSVRVERVDSATIAADELVGSFSAIARVDDGLLPLRRLDGDPIVRTTVTRIPWAYGAAEDVGGFLGALPRPDGAEGTTVTPAGVVVPGALHRAADG